MRNAIDCKAFLAALVCCLAAITIPSQAQTPCLRAHLSLDSDWKFAFGNAQDPKKDFNYGLANIFSKTGRAEGTAIDPRFKDSAWRTLHLPHDWAVELPFEDVRNFDVMSHGYKPVGGLFPETSIGWYRRHFRVPEADSGRRFQVRFDGVFRDAQVWINGIYLGNNKSGYVGFAYDITDMIRFNRDNVLVVRVDASQFEGWFYEGAGIYRHVWLNTYDDLHLATDGVYVHADVGAGPAVVHVESTLENEGRAARAVTVSAVLTDRMGRVVGRSSESPVGVAVDESGIVRQAFSVVGPHLWSTDDPYLYTLCVYVRENGRLIDQYRQRYGLRSIKVTAQGLFVNGRYVKIHGTNNHQDHAGLGSALPDYMQYYRVRLLKQMGVNAYRTSHNAPTPELLDACDSLGVLVLDEQRGLNSGQEYRDQFERLIRRDRSRTCVFMWSIGNEEGYIQTNSTGKRIAETFISLQRHLDPSRTCTYAADVPNVYRGVNEVIPVRGFNYRQFAVDDYHRDHSGQPIVGTEMGSTVSTRGIYEKDSVWGYLPDEDSTAPWWASRAETWWSLAAGRPWWMGGFVWTGFDYRGEPTPFAWPNISSHFGVMDVCGFPKNIYYYYQSWWSSEHVLHLSPHWNWNRGPKGRTEGREGQPINVWVNSNADSVALFLNGQPLGVKTMPVNGHLEWEVPYAPGTLKATGYGKGWTWSTSEETTDSAREVIVTPYKTTMLGDGTDVAVINISAVDRAGREVPDADNLIHFSVAGDARIIGTGNGDPSSHEQDRYDDTVAERHLFNGKCQVILQAGTSAGVIHFFARSEGLRPGNTTIMSVHPGVPHPVRPVSEASEASGTLPAGAAPLEPILGADISFLPQFEDRGIKFSDGGVQKDAVQILRDHGFNWIRLRIFVDPAADSGYSPKRGFCDLAHTEAMARRVKAAGMHFLLDIHYSDYWADPQQQHKPHAWRGLDFKTLEDSVYAYTARIMRALKDQGTTPDMVQVGNEINHGILWPDGGIGNLDSLAGLLYAGVKGVKVVSPGTRILLHLALGGQNDEARFFLDNMEERGLPFDVIGLSYYPHWHGTTDDLKYNLADLSRHYGKDVVVAEYAQRKQEVNDIAFGVPGGRGKGTFIWEPLLGTDGFFDRDGKSKPVLSLYDALSAQYLLRSRERLRK